MSGCSHEIKRQPAAKQKISIQKALYQLMSKLNLFIIMLYLKCDEINR